MKYLLGIVLVGFAIFVVGGTYLPVIREEIAYDLEKFQNPQDSAEAKPLDTDFGILIPKINANARVIKNVDPYNSAIYQKALSRGVAHASGTSLPGIGGNIFIFSHSSSDFFNASKYNSIFYLLKKLEAGDQIKVYFEGQEYIYRVASSKVVNSDAIQYLSGQTKSETLTLMTCWPPGTSLKRLVVIAEKND